MKNLVVDKSGVPLRVYRGEHGNREGGVLQTKCHGFTFVQEREIALTYAANPNGHESYAEDPRVIEAEISICNPLFHCPDDPFIDFSVLAERLGREFATRLMVRYTGHVEGTGNWMENFAADYRDVEDLLSKKPEALNDLYLLAWPVLDDPDVVAFARQAGYDGAIHIGSGESACELEYRVFDLSQIKVIEVHEPFGERNAEFMRMRA